MTQATEQVQSADLEELRAELALTRLGHEILQSMDEIASGSESSGRSDESRLASFVADLIRDLYDSESSGTQNRMRLTTNLEMAADRLLSLAVQLQSGTSARSPRIQQPQGRTLGHT